MITTISRALLKELTILLMEECGETGQRASKASRFGEREIQPGQDLDNGERIILEFSDQCAVLDIFHTAGVVPALFNPEWIAIKKPKIRKWLAFSVAEGQVPPELLAEFDRLLELDAARIEALNHIDIQNGSAAAATLNIALNTMTPDQRMEMLALVTRGYCTHCGTYIGNRMCHCTNDD